MATCSPRVVVLGSTGFVGSHIVARLRERGWSVVPVPSAEIDLTDPGSVARLESRLQPDDAVVFVSALTPDKGRDIGTMMRNLQMGQHVCAALARIRCAHCVYISSDAVYADDAHPVRERSCTAPTSFHGVMHLARERMLVETAKAAGVPLALLRVTLLYGADDTHNGYGPNRFLRTALKDRTIALFGGGEEMRDHVYIDDVSRIVELVLRHRSAGILNVASGRSVSFRGVAETIAARVEGVTIQGSPRANPVTHRHFDITALAAAFPGFRFTSLDEGVQASVAAAAAASS